MQLQISRYELPVAMTHHKAYTALESHLPRAKRQLQPVGEEGGRLQEKLGGELLHVRRGAGGRLPGATDGVEQPVCRIKAPILQPAVGKSYSARQIELLYGVKCFKLETSPHGDSITRSSTVGQQSCGAIGPKVSASIQAPTDAGAEVFWIVRAQGLRT